MPGAVGEPWTELFGGKTYASGEIALEADGPYTWIFKKGN